MAASELHSSNTFFRHQAAQLFLLLLACAALYFPVIQFGFLDYDDRAFILNDPAIQQLSLENISTIFFEPYSSVWFPLARLSHAIDIAIFGHNAAGHHLVNALLHFLNASILLHVLLHLGRTAYPVEERPDSVFYVAIVSSVLFVVHPQHIDAVAWAIQRKELLATLFALLSIAAYLRQRTSLVGLCLTLAMLSKPSAVVLPVFFILLDISLIEPKNISIRRIAETVLSKWWMILLALAFAVATLRNHSEGNALWLDESFSLLSRVFLYSDNSLQGLSRFFTLQAGLFFQPIDNYITSGGWQARVSLVLFLLLLVTCGTLLFLGNRQVRMGAAGLLFYFAALLPAGGLIVHGNYAFGDRYLYLSSIGLYVSLFIGLCELFRRHPAIKVRQWLYLLVSTVLLTALLLSHQILPKWASTESIWLYDVNQRPDSVFANHMLGNYYFNSGNHKQALIHFEASIDSESEGFKILPRTASALYMAEILCDANLEKAAISTLARIPKFGGDINAVEPLLHSLRFSGKTSCLEAISNWYNSTRS
jgi:hypothetical protein